MSAYLTDREQLNAKVDIVGIVSALAPAFGTVAKADVHLFAFLSAATSKINRTTRLEWGYSFVGTKNGAPFADALEAGLREMTLSGELMKDVDDFTAGPAFYRAAGVFLTSESFASRLWMVQDVCSLVAYRSLPRISREVSKEPLLARSARLERSSVIDEAALEAQVLEAMAQIANVLPDQYPPSLPVARWLEAWGSETS
ncbi:hypothetical protein [Curtobacterium sp. MCLR17_044]|uniref:hypothetical protein n=1 Tax=Curtobacterium sp. MCLR17_044 TaxID=2175628 RepID=UPI0011B7C2E0|nr:hypothetical protein [Curtobacterium sp. MCLR17_044]